MTVLFFSYIADMLKSRLCLRHNYDMLDIPTDPEKTIEYVELNYSCSFKARAFAWLCTDSAFSDIRYLANKPCRWQLNQKVQSLTLISNAQLSADCVQTSVIYEEPTA